MPTATKKSKQMCDTYNCQEYATYGFKFATPLYCREHGLLHKAKSQFQICKCGNSVPRFKRLEDEKPSCCAKCKSEDMINCVERRCECSTHLPTYGFPTDKRANYCSECKKDGMVNLKDKNKRCECGKAIPSFGLLGGRPSHCVSCKKDEMINLILTICMECPKIAVFGFKKDLKPSYCSTHKKKGMENIITKKCGCGKAIPVFGLPGKRATCCAECKSEEMVNVSAHLCKCGKAQATFGNSSDTTPSCCKMCKEETMIDIRSKKCKCGKAQPNFGVSGEKPTCCVSCKSPEMINVRARMCKCGKSQPVFGFKDDSRPTRCATCKEPSMRDIRSQICKGLLGVDTGLPELECPFQSRSKKKYDYYCCNCFERNFPADPRVELIKGRTEETRVRDWLATEFPSYTFIHNNAIWAGDCDCSSRRRIDFRILLGNTLLCIEVDEDQHKYRNKEDEILRYDDLMMVHGGKFIFLRFNPDPFVKDGQRQNPHLETRFTKLKETLLTQIQRIRLGENRELVEVIYLFYDS